MTLAVERKSPAEERNEKIVFISVGVASSLMIHFAYLSAATTVLTKKGEQFS